MSKNDKGPIIGIEFRNNIFMCWNNEEWQRVDIIPEAWSWSVRNTIIPSTVCFTPTKILIGTAARNRMRQFPQSLLYESKR